MGGHRDVVETWEEAEDLDLPPLVVLEPLARFLDDLGLGSGPLAVEPLGEGHSNLTFLIRREGAEVVLRRPPRPPYPASAHDVVREARILAALFEGGARVPEVLAIHEEPDVVGAPFFLMRLLPGRALTREMPAELDSEAARAAIGPAMVEALVELHAIPIKGTPLAEFGKPTGYLERQLRRFSTIWAEVATRPLPEVERIHVWLVEHRPETTEVTVVHGDYRLGNVLFAPGDPIELTGILDWEMATIGDPLADLGYLLSSWAEPGDPDTPLVSLGEVTRLPGFSTRDDLRSLYAARSGRDLINITWYEILACWKTTVFLEANYSRYLAGTMHDSYYAGMDEGIPRLARLALARIESL